MPCTLTVTGKQFDPDPFLNKSKISPREIFRKGQIRENQHTADDHSGFVAVVSDRDSSDLDYWAIDFLESHAADLRQLADDEAVADLCISFRIPFTAGADTGLFGIDDELIQLAAQYGVRFEIEFHKNEIPPDNEQASEVILKESIQFDATGDTEIAIPDLLLLANRNGYLELADRFRRAAYNRLHETDVCEVDPDDHQHYFMFDSAVNERLSDRITLRMGTLTDANREMVFKKYGISEESAQRGDLSDRYQALIAWADNSRS